MPLQNDLARFDEYKIQHLINPFTGKHDVNCILRDQMLALETDRQRLTTNRLYVPTALEGKMK